jgi:hypothetical protein
MPLLTSCFPEHFSWRPPDAASALDPSAHRPPWWGPPPARQATVAAGWLPGSKCVPRLPCLLALSKLQVKVEAVMRLCGGWKGSSRASLTSLSRVGHCMAIVALLPGITTYVCVCHHPENRKNENACPPKNIQSQVLVAHVCNPSYLGGRDQEDHSWKPAGANSL